MNLELKNKITIPVYVQGAILNVDGGAMRTL
jgi:hypothetical protein